MTIRRARWRSGPQKRVEAQGALLRFAFTRTRILGVQVWSGAGAAATPVPELEFRVRLNRAAAWAPRPVQITVGNPVTLEVSFVGESPQLIEVRWLGPRQLGPIAFDGGLVPEWLAGIAGPADPVQGLSVPRIQASAGLLEGGDDPGFVAQRILDSADEAASDLDPGPGPAWGAHGDPEPAPPGTTPGEEQRLAVALFEQRRAAIDLRARIDRFFLLFDRRTDETLTEGGAVATGLELLRHHHIGRRRCAAEGRRRSHAVRAPLTDACTRIAAVFDHCMQESDLAEQDLDLAFELFVSGRISVVHPDPDRRKELKTHGATNSELYFLLAEFALACAHIEGAAYFTDERRLTWARRAGTFVRTTHILSTYDWSAVLVEAGADRGGAPLTPYAYFDGLSMSFERIEAFRAAYAAMLDEWGIGGDAPPRELLIEAWEDVLGRVLGEATHLSSLPRVDGEPGTRGCGARLQRELPVIDTPTPRVF